MQKIYNYVKRKEKRKKLAALFILMMFFTLGSEPLRLYASHELSFGIKAVMLANDNLLLNPPLPMLYLDKHKYKVSVQPYIFNGKLDTTPVYDFGANRERGEFRGWGMGGSISYGFAKNWGVYSFIIGSAVSDGNFVISAPEAGRLDSFHSEITKINASVITMNLGVAYQFFGKKEGGFTLPVLFGPTMTRINFNQTMTKRYGPTGVTPPGTKAEAVQEDFDIAGNQWIPGYLLGVQAGVPMGKYFKLNPFVIFGMYLQKEISPEVTAIRTELEPNSNYTDLAHIRRGRKPNFPGVFAGLGINLIFKPWGLSFNITSPFLSKYTKPSAGGSDSFNKIDFTQFSLSYSFGKYQK